jgi:hypothetical protein
MQLYLRDRVNVANGTLILTTQRDSVLGPGGVTYNFSSGWVDTQHKVYFLGGRMEVRSMEDGLYCLQSMKHDRMCVPACAGAGQATLSGCLWRVAGALDPASHATPLCCSPLHQYQILAVRSRASAHETSWALVE